MANEKIKPPLWVPGHRWHDLWRGCVGYWPLWELAGLAAHDLSGRGNDGTLIGMDPLTDWVGTAVGSALDFDGTIESVQVADGYSWLPHNEITVAILYRIDAATASALVAWNAADVRNRLSVNAPWNDGNYYWDFGSLIGTGRLSGVWPGTIGQWGMIACVSSSAGQAVYWDGQLINSDADADIIDPAVDVFRIGNANDTPARSTNGQITLTAIWDRRLTDGAIRELNDDPFCMIRPDRRIIIPFSAATKAEPTTTTTAAATTTTAAPTTTTIAATTTTLAPTTTTIAATTTTVPATTTTLAPTTTTSLATTTSTTLCPPECFLLLGHWELVEALQADECLDSLIKRWFTFGPGLLERVDILPKDCPQIQIWPAETPIDLPMYALEHFEYGVNIGIATDWQDVEPCEAILCRVLHVLRIARRDKLGLTGWGLSEVDPLTWAFTAFQSTEDSRVRWRCVVQAVLKWYRQPPAHEIL